MKREAEEGKQRKALGSLTVEFVSPLMAPLCIEFSNEAANTV